MPNWGIIMCPSVCRMVIHIKSIYGLPRWGETDVPWEDASLGGFSLFGGRHWLATRWPDSSPEVSRNFWLVCQRYLRKCAENIDKIWTCIVLQLSTRYLALWAFQSICTGYVFHIVVFKTHLIYIHINHIIYSVQSYSLSLTTHQTHHAASFFFRPCQFPEVQVSEWSVE